MRRIGAMFIVLMLLGLVGTVHAAGTLTPARSPGEPIRIRDHHVDVVINNGFARTEVTQTFHNPNDTDLEALYSFPVPKGASLSEVTIWSGEREIHGEVLERERASQIYREEQKQGNEAGLATKNGYQTFEFAVWPVPAGGETRVRFVYYQALQIDTSVGRYVYPLADGGTDDAAASFWQRHERVDETLTVRLELKSAWPVADVRVPGFEADARVEQVTDGHYRVILERNAAQLDKDFVLYYRLQDDLPGRVELVTYRPGRNQPGTFMLVVTPGVDLKPITTGADYVFVLDVSGSMRGEKLRVQAGGVARALAALKPTDRFRITTFAARATELTRGWTPATAPNVTAATQLVAALGADGSTNLYDGLALGLGGLDDDRATAVLLATDGVTNTGIVEPAAFTRLLKQYDVRLFGFLIGNNANWPLMRAVTEATDGFYATVSTQDDLIGQMLLAKGKIGSEAMHDVSLKISGVKIFDATAEAIGKVYRGQQVVVFGRYERGGRATVTLDARMTGEDRTYRTTFEFPDVDTRHPEIERLWALDRIEMLEVLRQVGRVAPVEAENGIRKLGVAHQLVTDYTAMVVVADERFEARSIERRNHARVGLERQAQAARAGQPAPSLRVDQHQPMFPGLAPAAGHRGGGALDPLGGALALAITALAFRLHHRHRRVVVSARSGTPGPR